MHFHITGCVLSCRARPCHDRCFLLCHAVGTEAEGIHTQQLKADVWQHVTYMYARVIRAALTHLDCIWQHLLYQPLLDGRRMWQVYLVELHCKVGTLNTHQRHC